MNRFLVKITVDLGGEIAGGRVTTLGFFLEAFEDDIIEIAGKPSAKFVRRCRALRADFIRRGGAPFPFALNYHVVNGGIRNSTRLTTAGNILNNVRWSSDGRRVCFNNDSGGFKIAVSDVAAPAPNAVSLSDSGHLNSQCRWSADGSLVAYLEQSGPGAPADLEIRKGDASAPAEALVSLAAAGRTIRKFEWAPGSNDTLAYIADAGAAGVDELYVVKQGGAPQKVSAALVANGDVLDFAWSPDGTRLAYAADAVTDTVRDLFIVSANGGAVERISDFLGSEEVVDFVWSPDSSVVALSAGPIARTPVADRLIAASADGASFTEISPGLFQGIFKIAYAN